MSLKKDVIVIIGAGGIGVAIARRQSFGKTVLLADASEKTLQTVSTLMKEAGYEVLTQRVDVTDRESVRELAAKAKNYGTVLQVINTAGLSPNMASVTDILKVDLYGAAVVFEEFGEVIAPGGAGLIISSMAGHMLPALSAEQEHALINTPTEQLTDLPFLQPEQVANSGAAYMLAKRANHLHVQAFAVKWGERYARLNSISPGIVMTPLAQHELNSPGGDIYRTLIQASSTKRVASADEIAVAASFLLGYDGGFITGSDLLIDGGVIAAIKAGKLG